MDVFGPRITQICTDFFRQKDPKARRKNEGRICSKRRNWLNFYFWFFLRKGAQEERREDFFLPRITRMCTDF